MPRFYRLTTDQQMIPAAWENACAGPTPSACWLIGGGPSLAQLPCGDIAQSPLPKMTVNLSGAKRIRPNFWTAYDPTLRFHRSIYLDAGVVKFLPRSRAMDFVPETTFKVCECPQTYFFDRDAERGYHNVLAAEAPGIVDWADTLVQAIDILYRVRFRRIYLAGCDLCVKPSHAWEMQAVYKGVTYREGEPLSEFRRRCRDGGLSDVEQERLGAGTLYHFDETKPFESLVRTDGHYFRIVQALRLSRQAISTAGLQLISVTPHSRLNHFFDYQPVEAVMDHVRLSVGDPLLEPTRGLYTQTVDRRHAASDLMRDLPPHRRKTKPRPCGCKTGSTSVVPPASPELIVERERWEPVATAFAEAYVEPIEEA